MEKDTTRKLGEVGEIVTDHLEAKNQGKNPDKEKYVEKASKGVADEVRSLCNTVDFLTSVRAGVLKKMKEKQERRHAREDKS